MNKFEVNNLYGKNVKVITNVPCMCNELPYPHFKASEGFLTRIDSNFVYLGNEEVDVVCMIRLTAVDFIEEVGFSQQEQLVNDDGFDF